MTPPTDILSEPLGGLSREDWLARIEDMADEDGYFEPIGDRHFSAFVDRTPDVLLVSFEEADQVRLTNKGGHPIGFRLAVQHGWSTLSILSKGET